MVEIKIERVEYCFNICLDEKFCKIIEVIDVLFKFDKVLEDVMVLMELM